MKKMKQRIALFLVLCMIVPWIGAQPAQAATAISKCSIKMSTSYGYTSKAIKPKITIKYKKKALKSGKDYVVTYKNNTNPGKATVTIKGKGKYSGSVKKTFTIKNTLSISGLKKSYTYTGKAQKPSITVKSGKKKLSSNYYSISYKSNKNVGTASIIVLGKGKYKGKNALVTFQITKAASSSNGKPSIEKATVRILEDEIYYNGHDQLPAIEVKLNGKKLKDDYFVSYRNNHNAGTAKIILTGKGNYTGTKTVTFQILPRDLSHAQITIEKDTYVYQQGKVEPKVTSLKENNVTLVKNRDYYISYKNNEKPGTGQIVITGTGNYSGSRTQEFHILADSNYEGEITDESDTFSILIQSVNETDSNGNVTVLQGDYGPVALDMPNVEQETLHWTASDSVRILSSNENNGIYVDYLTADKNAWIKVTKNDKILGEILLGKINFIIRPCYEGDRISVRSLDSGYTSDKIQTESPLKMTNGQTASSVISQPGLEEANGSRSAGTNCLAYSKIGDVYHCFVTDPYNNRVLCYKGSSVFQALNSEPLFALGQTNLTDAKVGYGKGDMNWPLTVATDTYQENGNTYHRLYVTDTNNNRILIFEDITKMKPNQKNEADFILYAFKNASGERTERLNWPWSIATANVKGKDKVIIANTRGANVLIFDKPDGKWTDKNVPDVTIDFEISSTPRTITWTGTQLLIGDENLEQINRSGFYVFNEFPTKETAKRAIPYDFRYIPEVGHGEGTLIEDKLYLVYAGAWNIFERNADGSFIENPNHLLDVYEYAEDGTAPDRSLGALRGQNGENGTGYALGAGCTQQCIYVAEDDILYLPSLDGRCIAAYQHPASTFANLSVSPKPNYFIGRPNNLDALSFDSTNYSIRNPDVAAVSQGIAVADDLYGGLNIYKSIPTSDGALPDYIYRFAHVPDEVNLYEDENGKVTMIVVGTAHHIVYIWEDYKFDGAMPDRILANTLGEMNFIEDSMNIANAVYDGTYFYLCVNDNKTEENVIYIYKGLPEKFDNPIASLRSKDLMCNLSANDDYIAVSYYNTPQSVETAFHMGVVLYEKATFANGTTEHPISFDISDAYGIANQVNCGLRVDANALPNGVQCVDHHACYVNNFRLTPYTDEAGNVHWTHENGYLSLIEECLLTKDGQLCVADAGNSRVVIWDSIDAAIGKVSNPAEHVTILGHGSSSYTESDLERENANEISANYTYIYTSGASSLFMPRCLAYDGMNLWIGEFKFSNRLLRYETDSDS